MATRPAEDTSAPAPSVTEGAPSFEDAFAAAAAAENEGETNGPVVPAAGDPPPAPAGGDPAPAPPEGEPPAGEPAAAPAAENPTPGGDAGGAPPAPAEGTPPAAPAAPAAPVPPAPAVPSAEEIVKQLTEKLAQPAPTAPAPVAPEPQPEIFSPEEQATLVEYEKNWPDVSQAEALKRKAEYHDLLKYTFTEVHKFLQPHLAQIAAMGNTLHTQELSTLVSDYTPAVEAEVMGWIDTQPSYLQGPYKQVMQTGTSEEVADLIGRYRAANGMVPAPASAPAGAPPVPAAPAAPAQAELSPLAKQAAQSLAPVSSDRTQVPAGEDPQDYNAAFARYASEASLP